MIRNAIAAAALTLGMASAAQAIVPAAPVAAPAGAPQAQKVVEVFVGGGYYGRPRYYPRYRYYPWHRPWYGYGGPFLYEPPPPVAVVAQPPPQPVWTGSGVIWMFPGGAPQ